MGIYQYKDIKMVHLELTSKCNASCPMCGRNEQGGPVNPRLPLTELTLQQAQKIFSPDFLGQLKKIYLCGNFGDPIMAQECLEILKYFRSANPDLNLGLHTNGGARDVRFWQELAQTLSYCRFGIDGLKDTNHLYRQGVKWDLLERNIQAFIQAGGHAEWDFLVFKHNQHQVQEARELADKWGVKKISIKSTSRFFSSHRQSLRPSVEVHNQKSQTTHLLERADHEEFQNPFYQQQENILGQYGSLQAYWDKSQISCKVAAEKSLYITSQGFVFPCCWIGNELYAKTVHSSQNQLLQILEQLPEKIHSVNALEKSLSDIVGNDLFQNLLEDSWGKPSLSEGKMKTCARTCGQDSKPFEGQFL